MRDIEYQITNIYLYESAPIRLHGQPYELDDWIEFEESCIGCKRDFLLKTKEYLLKIKPLSTDEQVIALTNIQNYLNEFEKYLTSIRIRKDNLNNDRESDKSKDVS